MALLSFLDREKSVAHPGYSRWLDRLPRWRFTWLSVRCILLAFLRSR
jgi:hypothetical protein